MTSIVGSKAVRLTSYSGGANATLTVPAGALPYGTKVGLFAVKNSGPLLGKFKAGDSYLVSFAVAWKAPNGGSPAASAPLSLEITDPSIHAGDIIYALSSSGLKAVGVATVNGKVTVSFENDPDFLVANVPELSSVGAKGVVTASAVKVKIGCTAGIRCVGYGTVTAKAGKGKAARSVKVAQGHFTIPAGRTKTVSLTKTGEAGRVLVSHPKKHVEASLSISLAGGRKTSHKLELP